MRINPNVHAALDCIAYEDLVRMYAYHAAREDGSEFDKAMAAVTDQAMARREATLKVQCSVTVQRVVGGSAAVRPQV